MVGHTTSCPLVKKLPRESRITVKALRKGKTVANRLRRKARTTDKGSYVATRDMLKIQSSPLIYVLEIGV